LDWFSPLVSLFLCLSFYGCAADKSTPIFIFPVFGMHVDAGDEIAISSDDGVGKVLKGTNIRISCSEGLEGRGEYHV
jgi:hypothetical protein